MEGAYITRATRRRPEPDVEIGDEEANTDDYDPKESAKFLATDTEEVYVGDGAALAAIQGLSETLDEKDDRIRAHRERIETRHERIEALTAANEELTAETEMMRERIAVLEERVADRNPTG